MIGNNMTTYDYCSRHINKFKTTKKRILIDNIVYYQLGQQRIKKESIYYILDM